MNRSASCYCSFTTNGLRQTLHHKGSLSRQAVRGGKFLASSSSCLHSSSVGGVLRRRPGSCLHNLSPRLLFSMSASVLMSRENLPVCNTANQDAAGALEPPSKQARLEQPCSFKVKLLNEHAKPPQRGSQLAAGYDLFSSEDTVVPARGKALVKTGIAIHTPPGTYGRVAPRSGLAVKHFIDVGAGVVDEDYRGEVRVLLFNHEEKDFPVSKGDRIAQLVLECIKTPPVEVVEDLDATDRGAGGFGSTGGFGNTGATN